MILLANNSLASVRPHQIHVAIPEACNAASAHTIFKYTDYKLISYSFNSNYIDNLLIYNFKIII